LVLDIPDLQGAAIQNYTLDRTTRYLQIEMTSRSSGRVELTEATLVYACSLDTDEDGIQDNLDLDSDNDGIHDIVEAGNATVAAYDIDGNGRIDTAESFVDDAVLANANADNGLDDRIENLLGAPDTGVTPVNSDTDGLADVLDLDSDNDAIPDNVEAQTTAGYTPLTNLFNGNGVNTAYLTGLTPEDTDGDGTPDYLDSDSDDDGTSDLDESFSTTPGGAPGSNGLLADAEPDDTYALETINGDAYTAGTFGLLDTDGVVLPDGSNAIPLARDFDYRDRCDELNVNVFLEGAYNGTDMITLLNEYHLLPGQDPSFSSNPGAQLFGEAAPVGQPYNVAPFNYAGTEGDLYGDTLAGATPYPATVVDWVLLSVREDPMDASTKIWESAALLHEDGSVEIPEGSACLELSEATDYHIVVQHRNHLAVMSTAVQKVDGSLTFDFTNNDSWKFDIGSPQEVSQKQIGGRFVMYVGNADQTSGRTDLTSSDNVVWTNENGEVFRYKSGDNSLNADVTSSDRVLWNNNTGLFNLIPF